MIIGDRVRMLPEHPGDPVEFGTVRAVSPRGYVVIVWDADYLPPSHFTSSTAERLLQVISPDEDVIGDATGVR